MSESTDRRADHSTPPSHKSIIRYPPFDLPICSGGPGLFWTAPCPYRTYCKNSEKQSQLKRNGCIFTCLKYRVVCIEIASDLSTDSFIIAMMRFVGRRGPPRVIYSDNGTSFRGAESDVSKGNEDMGPRKIGREQQRKSVQWYFNLLLLVIKVEFGRG